MRKLLIFLILGLALRLPLAACLELDFMEDEFSDPLFASQSTNPGDFFFENTEARWDKEAEKWKAEWMENGKWRDRSRYAVCLAFLEEYDEALKHFKEIEAEYPGHYSTAINLATVYEQKKQYKEALKWMEKAIALDPDAHYSSEWIHLNILRLEAAGKQRDCTSILLIETDFGPDPAPKTELSDAELEDLIAEVFFQLDQRVYLNPDSDPCSAHLLFDLGNLNFLRHFPTACIDNYGFAEEMGFNDPLLEIRKNSVAGTNYNQPPPTYASTWKPSVEEEQTESEEMSDHTKNVVQAFSIIILILLMIGGTILIIVLSRRKPRQPYKRRGETQFEDLFDDQN